MPSIHRSVDKAFADEAQPRAQRKRLRTRALLLAAAYEEMCTVGVDDAKIKDITDRADIGFGTFYNYFDSKDHLARSVLDCVINDMGNRNDEATQDIKEGQPLLTIALSIRLMIREAINQPMWRWWALRPDLLATRMQLGFAAFGRRDMIAAIKAGSLELADDEMSDCWRISIWLMVGVIHDIIIGDAKNDSESIATRSILRVMGASKKDAAAASSGPLPPYPAPKINFGFDIDQV